MEKERQIPSDAQLLARWVTSLANKPDERVASTGQRIEKLIMIGSMGYEKIEQYVADLLELGGLPVEGEEQRVRTLLHHLYCAVAMFEGLSPEERALVAGMQKKFRYFFETNCNLKERKRKNEKEKFPPAPPIKEKEKKEKDEKNSLSVGDAFSDGSNFTEARKEAFRKECLKYIDVYDVQLVTNFFNYWSETNRKTGLMRWEMEKTWETKKRLARWVKNQFSKEITAADIRLERTKGKESKQAKVTEQQQLAAQLRQQQEEAERRKDEEAKANRMDSRDYVKINPNGFLAKLQREEENKKSNKNK